MSHEEHLKHASKEVKKAFNFAVLTVSDTRTNDTDESGKILCEILKNNKHNIIYYEIVKDDGKEIEYFIKKAISDENVEVLITNGGTGISKRDVTIETVKNFFEKTLDGFGEIFRYLSYTEIGSGAIMSRATAGVCRGKIVFSIPGSPNAVRLAMDKIIIPEISHIIWEVR
ncbi:MAG: molybdenum cofactor biosynthesis protein MoaB [Candidatus Altiarchaeum hamiconexum]|uniref:Molybdenum cofactor biosynthesis protein MoaB n=1 Tax=Candidatus Altarchaeum hamiconexum TaxID=1803513 RepID=A0A8J7YWF6_9ARCH|nr:molybdenum cofactor biosynthesis protein MoaB [Candidatus Altarchaeum hamiconexum]OIQ06208.1 MAG: molybdenum cofactor biosynthesis protein [Candidatus Altarchaeum sp. CG2_30_32_3053]PIN67356.1 MAG: molybdenum cofactor biosynthesis protein [Candidatus Altarchaeum sp. CG12_big_fil_rev_8_21_14_0_65_33_22]PIV27289.1 MAG: molybdenum cofactor biosynthesis protein [Candidatus Altarchaeum sp. CG03_land_8_20_14_0_80_32_618]PIX49339.1 MAG: molybdenum cofactor biosynthesis protein [Candidatus Altarchae